MATRTIQVEGRGYTLEACWKDAAHIAEVHRIRLKSERVLVHAVGAPYMVHTAFESTFIQSFQLTVEIP